MKMDSHRINGGLPRSPKKPPLPPKPSYIPPRHWSESKSNVETSSRSSGNVEIAEKTFCESLFLSRTISSSYSMSPLENTSIQSQSEEFFSFNSSFNISLDSPVSLTSSESFRDDYRINENKSTENFEESFESHFINNIAEINNTPTTLENTTLSDNFLNDQGFDNPDKCDNFSMCSDSTIDESHSSKPLVETSTTEDTDRKLLNDKPSKEHKVFLIAKEFTTSEQEYVDALKLLVVEFRVFLDNYGITHNITVIPSNELDKIFNTLPQILQLNEVLLNDLKNRIDNWPERKRIADVIASKGPFLKLYAAYLEDFQVQCSYIDECCNKYNKFSKALSEFEMSPACKKLTLKHYMLKPVQRIPHYRLLLEKYLSHLDNDSEEYHDTEKALNIIKDVLQHADSKLKLADNFWKLLQIQSSVGNYEIIKPGRLFVKEGELRKLSRKDIQLRFIILLSDCLLYTILSSSTTGLKVKYELPLSGMKVCTQPGVGTDFSIITNTRSFTLRAKNEHECNEWVKILLETISDNISRQLTFAKKTCSTLDSTSFDSLKLGREAPVWVQDKSTTMCQICTAEFTVTFRRHHCRCCGKVVCNECSSSKAPLQYLKFRAERVCEECYWYLLQEFHDPQAKMSELIQNDLKVSDQELDSVMDSIKSSFKKIESVKKIKKYIPQRLKEVRANDHGSSMSGWLWRRSKNKKEWKKLWFVLKDQVLYMYKASHDVVAYDSLPVLGYAVDRPDEVEDFDASLIFRLSHAGQMPVIFSALSKQHADMWVAALTEATVLK